MKLSAFTLFISLFQGRAERPDVCTTVPFYCTTVIIYKFIAACGRSSERVPTIQEPCRESNHCLVKRRLRIFVQCTVESAILSPTHSCHIRKYEIVLDTLLTFVLLLYSRSRCRAPSNPLTPRCREFLSKLRSSSPMETPYLRSLNVLVASLAIAVSLPPASPHRQSTCIHAVVAGCSLMKCWAIKNGASLAGGRIFGRRGYVEQRRASHAFSRPPFSR